MRSQDAKENIRKLELINARILQVHDKIGDLEYTQRKENNNNSLLRLYRRKKKYINFIEKLENTKKIDKKDYIEILKLYVEIFKITDEQTQQLLTLYEKLGTEGIDEIAELMKKPVRSIRSKLVKEGVYVPAQKQDNKKNGPSKKELLNTLETIVGFDTTGFSGSTKQVLADLIVYLDKSHTK